MEGRWIETMNRRRSGSARQRVAARYETSSTTMNLQRMQRRTLGRRVRELRRLVPGGRDLCADQLFLRTADYISELRMQVQALRALSNVYFP